MVLHKGRKASGAIAWKSQIGRLRVFGASDYPTGGTGMAQLGSADAINARSAWQVSCNASVTDRFAERCLRYVHRS